MSARTVTLETLHKALEIERQEAMHRYGYNRGQLDALREFISHMRESNFLMEDACKATGQRFGAMTGASVQLGNLLRALQHRIDVLEVIVATEAKFEAALEEEKAKLTVRAPV